MKPLLLKFLCVHGKKYALMGVLAGSKKKKVDEETRSAIRPIICTSSIFSVFNM